MVTSSSLTPANLRFMAQARNRALIHGSSRFDKIKHRKVRSPLQHGVFVV